jgi:hypothetical protein
MPAEVAVRDLRTWFTTSSGLTVESLLPNEARVMPRPDIVPDSIATDPLTTTLS